MGEMKHKQNEGLKLNLRERKQIYLFNETERKKVWKQNKKELLHATWKIAAERTECHEKLDALKFSDNLRHFFHSDTMRRDCVILSMARESFPVQWVALRLASILIWKLFLLLTTKCDHTCVDYYVNLTTVLIQRKDSVKRKGFWTLMRNVKTSSNKNPQTSVSLTFFWL